MVESSGFPTFCSGETGGDGNELRVIGYACFDEQAIAGRGEAREKLS